MSNNTSSGIYKSGLDAKRCKNLAHATPIDSFSNCLKLRMSIGRESMRSDRENECWRSISVIFATNTLPDFMKHRS